MLRACRVNYPQRSRVGWFVVREKVHDRPKETQLEFQITFPDEKQDRAVEDPHTRDPKEQRESAGKNFPEA